MTRLIWIALLGIAGSCSVGCGGDRLPLVPVSGRVTFDGGPCPRNGTILFVQVPGTGVAGMPNRPARAAFGTDGRFAATSFTDADGLLPGRYQVTVSCLDGEPGPDRPREQISFVPLDYRPEELVVAAGQGAIEVNFDVPPKKKK